MDGVNDNIDLGEFDGEIRGDGESTTSKHEYIEMIREFTCSTNDIRAGLFYSFSYKPVVKKETANQFVFTDYSPLIYLYGPAGKDKLEGLNFHFLPVDVRLVWLDLVDKMSRGAISKNEKVNIPPDMLKRMGKKLEFARRVYDTQGIKEWKRIDSSNMWELCKMKTNTYGGAKYSTIVTAFTTFNPPKLSNGSRG